MIFVREIHFKSTACRSVHSPLSITSTCQYTANIGLAYMKIRMTIVIVERFVGEPSSRVATRLTQRGITRQSSQQSVFVAAAAAASDCSAVDEVRYHHHRRRGRCCCPRADGMAHSSQELYEPLLNFDRRDVIHDSFKTFDLLWAAEAAVADLCDVARVIGTNK